MEVDSVTCRGDDDEDRELVDLVEDCRVCAWSVRIPVDLFWLSRDRVGPKHRRRFLFFYTMPGFLYNRDATEMDASLVFELSTSIFPDKKFHLSSH